MRLPANLPGDFFALFFKNHLQNSFESHIIKLTNEHMLIC
ncbi:hypothetical protein CLOSTMETH_03301 [[Clostridium] methylpentosum DSM 5476]|uniref:Uncharacterized protein n=1 Tax=[Clostridium] methylpentosum DSM 5476 TaxID=537013 RepID=C0EHA1_9FIRM|nr:hypothetical protein CLOSTMETH_03301 [[Clostridium] methylpentosum DSM 5476]